MKQKLQEIIERLDRIEQTVNLVFSAEKGREQMRAGDYAEDPFVNNNWGANFEKGCMCGTSARCYLHYPQGAMKQDNIGTAAILTETITQPEIDFCFCGTPIGFN